LIRTRNDRLELPDLQAPFTVQTALRALKYVQCGIVAATLIEHVGLHHVARPRVVDDEHLERLDDVVGVYMGPDGA